MEHLVLFTRALLLKLEQVFPLDVVGATMITTAILICMSGEKPEIAMSLIFCFGTMEIETIGSIFF